MNVSDNNVVASVNGSKLTLEIDLSKSLGRSSTGKSEKVASSGGFQAVDGGTHGAFHISLNVIQK
jgi:hypothetical protein